MIRVIRKKTGHLIEITRDDGTKDVSWDWDQLLEDVRAATSVNVTVDSAAAKGLKKKGIDVKKEVTQALANEGLVADIKTKPTKKPAAKKPAAKKPAAKKAPAKKK